MLPCNRLEIKFPCEIWVGSLARVPHGGARPMATENDHIRGGTRLSDQGALLIPNRLAFDELLVLEKELQSREVAYLVEAHAVLDAPLRGYLENDGVTTLQFDARKDLPIDLQKALHQEIAKNRLVIFVPGRSRTCADPTTTIPSKLTEFLLETRVRVHGIFVARPFEARFPFEALAEDPGPVFVITEPLERESVTMANFQEKLMEAGVEAFQTRSFLGYHLGFAVLSGLKQSGATAGIIDGIDDSETPYDKILAASLALAKVIKKRTSKKRVGIILPPSRGGFVANIAVLLANKVPVNLNFTASTDAVASAIRQGDLDLFLSGTAFMEKMTRFSWPDSKAMLLLDQVLPKIKWKIACWLVVSRMLSARRLAALIGLPEKGGDEEAVLLFTSGSSGEPKGVVLSHANLLANVNQFACRLNLSQTDKVLGCLPLFHSFGCTVTMWYPFIEGYSVVSYPSPVETKRLAELIETYQVNLLLGTPTFLRGYLRKGTPEQFASIKLVVSGAEKLPAAVSEAFREKLGLEILEGYGLTETSPVTNANLPDPEPDPDPNVPVLPGLRRGSVGHLLPGIAARITDPDSDLPQPLHETGMIWLKGANIFQGYLNDPKRSHAVLQGGWFKTGDIGRLDADGFLFIEGRLSRFSKIGGEMVPHETVETYLNNALQFGSSDERRLAIAGIPDPSKGEALVLLCTDPDLDFDSLRKHLIAEGVPSLWVPKKWKHVETIPCLASGKLDIRACQELALAS